MDSNRIFLIILGIFTYFLLYKKRSVTNITGFIIFVIVGYIVTKDITLAISLASIILYCFVYLSTNTVDNKSNTHIEKFKNKKRRKKQIKKKVKKVKKDKKLRKKKKKEDGFGFNNKEDIFDSKNTFVENYKSMSPGQIKGLNKDTQNLISTQKNLIETLNNMGPSLKQGKQVLDTFKNYFGNDMDLGLNKLKE